jgi:hypothetical protein
VRLPRLVYDEGDAIPDLLFLLGASRNMVRNLEKLYRLFDRMRGFVEFHEYDT